MNQALLIRIQGAVLTALMVCGTVIFPASANSPFTDVSENFAYNQAIGWAKDEGVVTGYEDGSFKPKNKVNRAEALAMILRLADKESASETKDTNKAEKIQKTSSSAPSNATEKINSPKFFSKSSFPDVAEDEWYSQLVEDAADEEVISGNSDGNFAPGRSVNRAEAIKMLVRATHKISELPNMESDPWYAPYMAYAEENALLIPDRNGDYLPSKELTRGELAELLYRFVKQPYTAQVEYGVASYYSRSYNGHNTASGKALDTNGFMCAHKTLPFGTKLRVTNVDSLNSVIVEVVDRGPYTPGYVADLTPAAFEVLEPLSSGLSQVRVEVLK